MNNKLGVNVGKTGIEGLDDLLSGGIPKGHVVLLEGASGSGKTVLSLQWLFEGWKKYQEPGIYIAITEPFTEVIKNASTLDFFDKDVIDNENIRFTDLRSMLDIMGLEEKEKIEKKDLEDLIERIEALVDDVGAKKIVIDSITAMGYRINNKNLFRHFIFRLGAPLAKRNVTAFLTSESQDGSTPFGVEDFISDGILSLKQEKSEQSTMRYISIPKMRGVDYHSGKVNFDIKSSGIKIYPKVRVDRNNAATDFQKRVGSGVNKFDEMLNGGYPEGHIILITGNSGTGKTTFGMQFLLDGINKNEKVIFVNLEEPKQQIIKTAEAHDWDFKKYEEKGSLKFITPNLIDTYPDKLLDNIVKYVEETGASRLFFDSISSLNSANFSMEDSRQMMLQLNSALKKRGVTALMTYLESGLFNAGSGSLLGSTQASELRLSSLSDGIIMLRYIESKDTVQKILTILKMRGTAHDKDIRKFKITDNGIEIGEVVEKRGIQNG